MDEDEKEEGPASQASPSPAIRNGFSLVSTDDDSSVRNCRNIHHDIHPVNTARSHNRRTARSVGDHASPLSHRPDVAATPGAPVAGGAATRRNRRSDNTLPPDGL